MRKIGGETVLDHLIKRLINTNIHLYIAVPTDEMSEFRTITDKYSRDCVTLVGGDADDPLARMYRVAYTEEIDNIIRVCHDKIFIDPDLIFRALDYFNKNDLDYLYSSSFTAGSGFEIIFYDALEAAANNYKGVEHISYAVRASTNNTHNWDVPKEYRSNHRFLIDYPEDLDLMQTLFSSMGPYTTLKQAIEFCNVNKWAAKINKLPKLSIYTCAYNAEKYLQKCMGSVVKQKGFSDYEYIIVDDFSSDKTLMLAQKLASTYNNVRVITNDENLGLSSSSNVALRHARGDYIVRIDADDFFPISDACDSLINTIDRTGKDVIYPNNYFGSYTKVEQGRRSHHVGGAIFNRRAINHIKFTDRLRGLEGYDFFLRARTQLRVGYLNKPIFFYRQHDKSLTKNNLKERKVIKDVLERKYGKP
jgi:glycosyltransferase involved in cell wall biosynthesis